VALVPVAFAVAMLAGEGLVGALGYPSGGEVEAPMWVALMVGLPLTLLGAAPGVAAVVSGRRARRAGERSGVVPAVVGAVVVLFWLVTSVAGIGQRLT
jgi:hypothetical protein